MDIKIPYLSEFFIIVTLILFVSLLVKGSTRWQALFTGLKSKGYSLSLKGFRKVMVYEGISLLYFFAYGLVMLKYIDIAFYAGVAGVLLGLEGLSLLVLQQLRSPFKVILNDKAITLITNELFVVSWNSIKKIDSRQNDVHLILKEGTPVLVDLEWLNKDDQEQFIKDINQIAQSKNIFCSIDCVGEYKDFTEMAAKPIFNE